MPEFSSSLRGRGRKRLRQSAQKSTKPMPTYHQVRFGLGSGSDIQVAPSGRDRRLIVVASGLGDGREQVFHGCIIVAQNDSARTGRDDLFILGPVWLWFRSLALDIELGVI